MLQRIKNEYVYISTFGRIFKALRTIEAKPDQIVPLQIAEFAKNSRCQAKSIRTVCGKLHQLQQDMMDNFETVGVIS